MHQRSERPEIEIDPDLVQIGKDGSMFAFKELYRDVFFVDNLKDQEQFGKELVQALPQKLSVVVGYIW